ncbi:MAG: response regulator [Candidatus Berkelbacteria bacterium]|nr:MAG: response regulator [Candidatus Berkelbacteria bacterium]QQG51993.1 MAG: response regulator [Candidatus Berkelbacteria bacterium]
MNQSKKQILIIEDDSLLRGVLRDELERDGFGVSEAKDGKVGLEMVSETCYDLILLDIVMPNRDGLSVLRQMRKFDKCAKVPVILLSNLNDPEKVAEAMMDDYVHDYLVKSDWSLADVSKKVKNLLGVL